MRLTCPNCRAQYEVDDKVIPPEGRDVQCSACGHTWYQYPIDVALQMRAADLDDDEDDDDDTDASGDGAGTARPPADGAARAAAPRIDKTVLDVLREEAERELRERRRGRGDLATQGDLGLTRPQRPRRAADPAAPAETDDVPPPPPPPDLSAATPKRPGRGRSVLPDIEELTSTLEPGDDERARGDATAPEAAVADPGGFGGGLSAAALIGMALVAVYLLAPLIAAYVPALSGALAGYVALVNEARAWVAETLRGLFGG